MYDNWQTDKDTLRAMPFEDLEAKLAPLINKMSHKAVVTLPGHDLDDVEQEIRLTLWKCQTSFDPTKYTGFGGKASSFMNFAIHAVVNRLNKLQQSTDKYYHPITELECESCKARVPAQGRTVCVCGKRRWLAIRDSTIAPMEALVQDIPGEQGVSSSDEDDFWATMREIPPDLDDVVQRILQDERVTVREKKALQAQAPRFEAYRKGN